MSPRGFEPLAVRRRINKNNARFRMSPRGFEPLSSAQILFGILFCFAKTKLKQNAKNYEPARILLTKCISQK
jgi:hypothetical protein